MRHPAFLKISRIHPGIQILYPAPVILAAAVFLCFSGRAGAESSETGRKFIVGGKYEEAIAAAAAETSDEEKEGWMVIGLEGLLALGKYPDALNAAAAAQDAEPRSLRVLWAARKALLASGNTSAAAENLRDIERLMSYRQRAYRDAESVTIYGRSMLLHGADPRMVLDRVYSTARKMDPQSPAPVLASGELALAKNDFALAEKTYGEALKLAPGDPEALYGLALARAGTDRARMTATLQEALTANPRHVPSLLRLADHMIDAENQAEAVSLLDRAAAVNPHHPDLWSYRAVLAHLRNDPAAEAAARAEALRFFASNPAPDHLIGRKLSQKYRFAEGAARQRLALEADPGYLPAKAQLANDLLRLGDEEEGWALAAAVRELDAYDIAAYNLMTLRDTMTARFTTVTSPHFTVRMDAGEAAVYGQRALDLLERARVTLSAKYGVEVTAPTIVEIFPEQKDFGVRTFGMPDNPGYLGVCFGRVVTATSPAARKGTPVNWEAVLWHEFCHTVTLQATGNKMPRWLSEGISVHEERAADPSWGERLIPEYRKMILGGELTPVSKLSGAFLSPKSPLHLQFAYYESSLVVEHILEKYGADALKGLLKDLAEGLPINEALIKRTVPMETLEKEFAERAAAIASGLAQQLNWEEPGPELLLPGSEAELAAWASTRPDNFHLLMRQAHGLIEDGDFQNAKPPLEKLTAAWPDQTGADGAPALLARVLRELGDAEGELKMLTRAAAADSAAPELYARLMDLDSASGNWERVRDTARRYLAVNPLIPLPWRRLAKAAEMTGDLPAAADALRVQLRLDPPNPAEAHYQLAAVLRRSGDDPGARRQALMALEETPRHRAALKLLLEINDSPVNAPPPAPAPQ